MDLVQARKDFFKAAQKEIAENRGVFHPKAELLSLWPDHKGGFDVVGAHAAFEAEGLHWEWEQLDFQIRKA
jgi:hypothetical protein